MGSRNESQRQEADSDAKLGHVRPTLVTNEMSVALGAEVQALEHVVAGRAGASHPPSSEQRERMREMWRRSRTRE